MIHYLELLKFHGFLLSSKLIDFPKIQEQWSLHESPEWHLRWRLPKARMWLLRNVGKDIEKLYLAIPTTLEDPYHRKFCETADQTMNDKGNMIEIFTVLIELAVYLLGSYTCPGMQWLFDVIFESRHDASMGYGFVQGPDLRDQDRTYVV